MNNWLMRGVIFSALGCAASVMAATSPDVTSTPTGGVTAVTAPVAPKGCLNRPLEVCLATLRHSFEFPGDDTIEQWIIANDAVDVNGKPIHQSPTLTLFGNFKELSGPGDKQMIVVDYSRSKVVSSVMVSLPADPAIAEQESGYRTTGLYEVMALVLGDDCPAIDRMDVYRFFQNTVKPRMHHDVDNIEVNMTNATWTNSHYTHGLSYCGRRFDYDHTYGTDTSDITLENEHGFSSLTSITLSSTGATESKDRKAHHSRRKHP